MENIKAELKKYNLLVNKIGTQLVFKDIQKYANELRDKYQIAIFEGNKEKIKEINSFLYSLVIMPLKEEKEGYIVQKAYGYIFNQLSREEKDEICRLLYDPVNIKNNEKYLKFYEEYIDMEQYAEITLISLFYLYLN